MGSQWLVAVADDLGICRERDDGIFRCVQDGIVGCASVLANGPTSGEAVQRAREYGVAIGLHLNLTEGRPLCAREDVRSIVDANGMMLGKHGFRNALSAILCASTQEMGSGQASASGPCSAVALGAEVGDAVDFLSDIRREVAAQIDWLDEANTSSSLSHVDGHQHVHVIPHVASILAADRRVHFTRVPFEDLACAPWVHGERRAFLQSVCRDATAARAIFKDCGVSHTDAFVGLSVMGADLSLHRLHDAVGRCLEGGARSIEYMCHPGYAGSSWDDFNASADREWEMQCLCDDAADLQASLANLGLRIHRGSHYGLANSASAQSVAVK